MGGPDPQILRLQKQTKNRTNQPNKQKQVPYINVFVDKVEAN